MSGFMDRMADTHSDLLDRVRPHPFFVGLARDEIPQQTVEAWLRQDCYWAREYLNALTQLCARAPLWARRSLMETMLSVQGHVDLFEKQVEETLDPSSGPVAPTYPSRALASFFLATVHTATIEEAIAADAAFNLLQYLAFSGGRSASQRPGRWDAMIAVRSEPNYKIWVDRIGGFADRAHEEAPAGTRRHMESVYLLTARFLLQYYDHPLRSPEA